jgi:hypothetical protein
MTHIVLDPGSMRSAGDGTDKAAHELFEIAYGLHRESRALPDMPPQALVHVREQLSRCADDLLEQVATLKGVAEELDDRANLAILAGAGDAFAGLMGLLVPALRWLYGGKEKDDGKLDAGGLFGGSMKVVKPSTIRGSKWSDKWWNNNRARNMSWKENDDWFEAGVKLWSKEVTDEANVWDSKGKYHNIAALGASYKAGANAKWGKDGLVATAEAQAAAYAFRGDVGFSGKHGDIGGGVFVGGLVEGKAQLKIARDQLNASVGGKAFVGGEAHAQGSVKAMGVKAGGNASVSYGLGATAKGEAAIGFKKVKLKGEIGATLGLGFSVGVDLEWSPADTVKDVGDLIKKIPKPKLKPPWDW